MTKLKTALLAFSVLSIPGWTQPLKVDPEFKNWVDESHLQFIVHNVGNHSASTHFGYGYLGTSELDSESAMKVSCESPAPSDDQGLLRGLREEAYRYLRFQQLALGASPSSRPACVSGEHLEIKPGTHYRPLDISTLLEKGGGQDLLKYYSLYTQLGINFTIRSLFWHDFAKRRIDVLCGMHNPQKCHAEKSLLQRIIQSQPMLFKADDQLLHTLRRQLYELLEAADSSISGIQQYEEGLKFLNADSQNSDKFLRVLDAALRDHDNLKTVAARKNIAATYRQLRRSHLSTLRSSIAALCELSKESLFSTYPVALRQFVFDKKTQLEDVGSFLCTSPAFREMQKSLVSELELRCVDYKTVKVQGIDSINFNDRFTITPFPKKILIKARIPIVPDKSLSPVEVQQRLRTWEGALNQYYNCQSGHSGAFDFNGKRFSCPQNFRAATGKHVAFDISFTIPSDPGSMLQRPITLHKCFDNDAPDRSRASDCAYLRERKIQNCQNHGTTRSFCEEVFPVNDIDTYNGRANSQNYIISNNDTTVIHEVGHFFRLRDEYNVGHLWNPMLLGGLPSIMASASADLSELRFLDRHFEQILEPLSCLSKVEVPRGQGGVSPAPRAPQTRPKVDQPSSYRSRFRRFIERKLFDEDEGEEESSDQGQTEPDPKVADEAASESKTSENAGTISRFKKYLGIE